MARTALLLVPALVLLAAPSPPPDPAIDAISMADARAELVAAERRSARLRQAAEKAAGTLAQVRAAQATAASELEAAEARITLAGLRLGEAEQAAAKARASLRAAQRPASSLLAGLASMARRPPLFAMVDGEGVEEIVRAQILLKTTMPAIKRKAAAFAADLARFDQLADAAGQRRVELEGRKEELVASRRTFAALEQRALALAARAGGAALEAGDEVLAAGDSFDRLREEEAATRATRAAAIEIARGAPVPARPGSADGPLFRAPFAYQLPAAGPITQGLGAVDSNGVRARGVTIATRRGVPILAPASSVVRFAGPFRGFDGVLILDHGGGWSSLMVNAASPLKAGQRVAIGDPVGRALGPLTLELSRGGKGYSPALIAGSSPPLSNRRKGG